MTALQMTADRATVQQEIFARTTQLVKDAEFAGIVIKLNMPTSKENATYGTRMQMTISQDGGKTIIFPEPNVTGVLLPK